MAINPMLEDAIRAYSTYDDRPDDPSTPAAGSALLYVKDGILHGIDDAGVITEYGPASDVTWADLDDDHDSHDHTGVPGVGGGGVAPVSQVAAGSVNANSNTPAAKTGGPAVTVAIGASGKALVSWGTRVIINSGTASRVASMGILMSGANSGYCNGRSLQTRNSPATFTVDRSDTTLVTGLAPGSTTFTAMYWCSSDNADFTERELIVIPI